MAQDKFEKIVLVHEHRLQKCKTVLQESGATLDEVFSSQQVLSELHTGIDSLLAEADRMMSIVEATDLQTNISSSDFEGCVFEDTAIQSVVTNRITIEHLDIIEFDGKDDMDAIFLKHEQYAQLNQVDLQRKISSLLTRGEIEHLDKMIDDDFTYKNANCDKYDYMVAGTAGVIGGIIDIVFVGVPKEGSLTKLSDKAIDNAVERFASLSGWDGPRDGKDSAKSAIGFLERKFKVNYDHRHGGDVCGKFNMSTKNHHIKSLAHSPDLIGLFFSILGQFTNTAYFFDKGKLIEISTENFELQGGNFAAKIFCGFVNWIGHLFSDVAGSSGAQGRGTGIPIPFYSLLQLLNVGEFGQHRQKFNTIIVQVFEQGYDFRHGIAMTIPVVVTELLVRIMFFVKQHFYHGKSINESMPSALIPEMRRMLLVGHGTLCLIDAGDAALRSGGEMIQFLLRTNLIAWVRFGSLAMKEFVAIVKQGGIDVEKIDLYIEQEYRKLLVTQ